MVYPLPDAAGFEAGRDSSGYRQEYRSLFEQAGDAIFLITLEGTLRDVNPAACRLLGYTREELTGQSAINFLAPEFRLDSAERLAALLQGHCFETYEKVFLDRSGNRIPGEIKATLIRNVTGEPQSLLAIVRDVSGRKQAEQALRESEDWFRCVFDGSLDAIFITGADGRFVSVNQAASTLTGYPVDRLLQMSIPDLHDEQDLGAYRTFFHSIMEGAAITSEAKIRRPDGTKIPVEFNNRRVIIQGRPYLHSVARDVSERKRAAAEKAKLFSAIEHASDALLLTGPDGCIQYANPAARQVLTGISPGLPPEGRLLPGLLGESFQDIWQAIKPSQPFRGRINCRQQDGGCLELECSLTPICDENNVRVSHVVAVVRDRSREARLEEQFLHAQKMEAIGTLAGGIAHDFNNILSAILGFADLAREEAEGNEELCQSMGQIHQAALRARELVRQILTFSRQSGQQFVPVQLSVLLEEARQLLRSSLPASIEIVTRYRSNSRVLADPSQLHQVVMNLGTNAYHAMRETGGELNITLQELASEEEPELADPELVPGRYLHLAIRDTGCGIHPAIISRIFEPYFTTKPKGEGTGLGLAVVHGIIRRHQGKITVRSFPGEGTVFNVYLPALAKAEPEQPVERKELPRGSGRLLVVDDEEQIVVMMSRFLQRLGYSVTSFTSSPAALRAVLEDPQAFDLLITDMTMPQLTGVQLAREIRRRAPRLPMLLCTGFNETISREKALAEGFAGFLMKPLLMEDLARYVQDLLERLRQEGTSAR